MEYPLSSAQKRIYALSQLDGGERGYHVPLAFFVQGSLDPARVEACLRTLIRRHPALRTGFHLDADDAVQRVAQEVPFTLDVRDSAPDVEGLARAFMQPFDLARPPLLRVCMVKVADDRALFLFDTHHIAFDGISGDILIGDLVKLLNGEELPALPADYRDYVARERSYLDSDRAAEDAAYWLDLFRAPLPALELPADRSRSAARTFRGRRIFHAIGRAKTDALKKLSQRNGSSLFMLLFAAYFTLLHKVSGEEDLAVGTTFDGRMDERFAGVVGMFVNTIAIRTRPAAGKSFKRFLGEVKRAVFEAFDAQAYPFEMIVAGLGGQRELSRNPIFDTMFVYEEIETQSTPRGGLTISKYDLDNRSAIFDLTHEVLEIDGALSVSMEYNGDIFEEATIRRFLAFYDRILDAVLEDQERRLEEIELLGADERHAILADFNATDAPSARGRSVVALFEAQVQQTPDATAVVCDGRTLTFGALNARANRLAHHLQTHHGVGPDVLVGVMMARSEWMVTAVLGVLKAGGAYVPIDADYPAERIRYMLADAGCRVVLTDTDAPVLPDGDADAPPTLDVRGVRQGSSDNPPPAAGPDDLCYVIYTSGSTGRPKGCQLEHRNLSHYIGWALQYYFEGRDYGSFGLYTSLSFDLTVTGIFCTLLRGRCLTIYGSRADTMQILAHNLDPESPVDCIKITPSHISLLKHLDLSTTNVQLAVVGGEQLTMEQVRLLRNLNPRMRIVNEYGPTEFTVGCIVREVMPDDAAVLIGKPIHNTRVYILDANMRPLPVGLAGEICLAGDGLARGYLNRPDLTDEKFVPDPFRPGERMYRTGDLGKWLPDGNIVCLGRIDHQVKLHGFRIEPGEIEALLVRHPEIDQAAVLLRGEGGERCLCAYLVCREALRFEALRGYLAAGLPAYMIPARFIRVAEMPLTPNGKIDGQALAALKGAGLGRESGSAAPATDDETLLAEIWQDVLGVEAVGVLDNYFALGGDSIKAIQILSRLKSHGRRLEVRHIFETPTIRTLAQKLTVPTRVPEQGPVSGRAPLTAIQRWLFATQDGRDCDHYAQAVLLRADARLDEAALQRALEALQAHHDALRTTFRRAGDTLIQETAAPQPQPLSVTAVDLRDDPDAPAELARLCADASSSLRLDRGPLLKTVLFRLADGDRLLVVVHHLVVDGVSWRILLEDLDHGYARAAAGDAPGLPPKTDAYRVWADAMARHAASPQLHAQRPFWEPLAAAEALAIPADFEADGDCYRDAATISVELDGEDTTALLTRAGRAYHTEINDLLLAALGRAMRRCYGAGAGLIELEGHGREPLFDDIDVSRTVGWFTSIYPALIDMPDSDDPGLQIRQVKEGLRRIPDKGAGYGILKYLAPADESGPLPGRRARIVFNYLGRFDETPRGGLRIADHPVANTIDGALARPCEIEIEGMVLDGRLKFNLSYNRTIHARDTVEGFLGAYRDELRALIRHCVAREAAEFTPHDLTYKDLGLSDLDRILTECGLANAELQDIYPLSPLQEGMLFQHMLDSGSSAYFVQIAYAVQGDLDPALFETCWSRLIQRHDILRTVFTHKAADRPLQVVARRGGFDFGCEDLAGLSPAEQARHLAEFKARDLQTGFDPTAGVPLRVRLFKTGQGAFEVVWSIHHLLSDGWCMGILMSEFFETYAALLRGAAPALPAAAPYGDYIRWLEDRDAAATVDYWRTYLQGFERPAGLPRRAAAGEGGRFDARTLVLAIDPPTFGDLQRFAADRQVTLNTVVQTAWGLVLSRFSGADDLVFGATVSGRPPQVAGIEAMAGLFINTIPVRIRIDPDDTVNRIVRRVQADALRGEPHHYGSLADIQAATPLKGRLMDHALVFENYPLAEEMIGLEGKYALGFAIRDVQVFEQTDYDLTIVVERGESLQIELRYNAAVLADNLMEQVKTALGELLGALAGAADTPVADLRLSLLSADEASERDAFMQSVQDISEEF